MTRVVRQWTRAAMAAGACAVLVSGSARMALAAPPVPAIPVTVKNTPSDPVPVRPVRVDEPFQQAFDLAFADGEGLAISSYTVPANKRLVIEYASLAAYLPPDFKDAFVFGSYILIGLFRPQGLFGRF